MNKILSFLKKDKFRFFRLPLQEQILFIKRLAILIHAGVPLMQSLQMLKKQTKSKTLNKILADVVADVENGQYLATSLGKFRKIFGEFAINIIEIGEVSGTLGDNLEHLAEELKKKQNLRRKVLSAMVYPIFIIFATFGITGMLTVFIFPKILPIFKSVNFDLPWTTKLLIFISSLLLHFGLVILIGLAFLIIAISFILRLPSPKFWYERLILSLPFIGSLSQSYNMANICRTLGLLLKSNVNIVRAVKITSKTMDNLVYQKELSILTERITKGEQLSGHFEDNLKLFPAMMGQMVSVGENTGQLSNTFLYLADMYEEEVEEITKNLSTVLEPLLLIFMGIIVGFVAVSIITPIYGITQHLNPK